MNRKAFTLVELLTVVAIIAILAGLVLATAGYIQKKAAMSRADAEINAMSAACESYKADNGIYPRTSGSNTDLLNARVSGNPTATGNPSYSTTTAYLYGELSGNPTGDRKTFSGKTYFEFKPQMLQPAPPSTATVTAILDPFGYSYGYSTAYSRWVDAGSTGTQTGYNPTFDLWSTCGSTTNPPATNDTVTPRWIKNW